MLPVKRQTRLRRLLTTPKMRHVVTNVASNTASTVQNVASGAVDAAQDAASNVTNMAEAGSEDVKNTADKIREA